MEEGHCGLPEAELVALAAGLLDVPGVLVEAALALELEAGEVVADALEGRRCVFLAGLHRAEREIAERLRRLAAGAPPWPPRSSVAACWPCSWRSSTRAGCSTPRRSASWC